MAYTGIGEYVLHRVRGPFHRLLEVAVVEHNRGTLAAEFECDHFEVTFGGGLEDFAADKGASGERDLGDVHVLADGLTDSHTWEESVKNGSS